MQAYDQILKPASNCSALFFAIKKKKKHIVLQNKNSQHQVLTSYKGNHPNYIEQNKLMSQEFNSLLGFMRFIKQKLRP
jgi:hypothetical protein